MALFLSSEIHQGDDLFSVQSRGKQCAFMSLSALLTAQNLPQPRTQALSSTLLAGENTLAGAGHVTHTKLIAYQGDGKVSGLILHVSTSALHTSIARSGRLKNHLSESYILQNNSFCLLLNYTNLLNCIFL
jgi:hypothetical protein